ncbi:MAG: hypothetical protein B7Z37_31385 [Verrucomicrobia bacterium 12-59-8]|nr:MAG: hypothetical protein B7Z37_31385 [Verrucomicrobia bacterium 12-59-8]
MVLTRQPHEGCQPAAFLKIAYFLTHPIQYQSPLIRAVRDSGIDVRVVYGPMATDWAGHDAELGRDQPWDVPLMDGYPYQILESPFWFGPAGFFCLRARIKEGFLPLALQTATSISPTACRSARSC